MFKNLCKKAAGLLTAAALLVPSLPLMTADSANYNRVAVHDPSIIKLEDGSYYIIGSHLGAARSTVLGDWSFTANSNLGTKNTTFFNDIYTDLAVPCEWSKYSNSNYDLSGNLWAPDIVYNEILGKYCMYLSVNGDKWKSSIVLCTADNIDGPYTYVDTVVYSGFNNSANNNYKKTDVEKVLGINPDISRYLDSSGEWNANYGTNAIDPCVFYDENGALWMVYGSWFGGLFMLELDENTGLRDYNVTYPTVTDSSDAYMGKKVAGGHWVSGEGPYIEYMEHPDTGVGYYYLFVSNGCFNNDGGYNMRIYRSSNPSGPYLDQNGNNAIFTYSTNNIGGTVGERLMSNYQWDCNDRPNKAQGHNSTLMDDDGKMYVIYHNKFDDAYGFHEVRVHQLIMNEDGWPTATAYEYTGEELSKFGHSKEAVVGEYEFIFHQLNQTIIDDQVTSGNNAEVEYSQDIVLNADGTVSGDVTGTWSMKDGSHEMTFSYNGVTYKGSFIVQADESAEMVQKMTFTATGNNTCVWGSKKAAYNAAEDVVDPTREGSQLVYNSSSESFAGGALKISGTDLYSDVPYFITNKFNGMSLDLAGGTAEDGTNIQQWGLSGGSHQEWRIVDLGNGYCKIVSMTDESMAITVDGSSADNGLNVMISTYTGADNQQWKLIQDHSFYGIVSKCSGDAAGLDVYDWSTESGGNINQWEFWGGACQLWKITPVYPEVTETNYAIRSLNSGLYLGADGTNVQQVSEKTDWSFKKNSDGTYSILNEWDEAVTIENSNGTDGNNAYLSAYDGSDAQKFTLRVTEDGAYGLLSVCSGNLSGLDVYGISLDPGANICQWNYWGGAGQQWILISAEVEQPEPVLPGDADKSGAVNIFDLIFFRREMISPTLTSYKNTEYDWNLDNEYNVSDLVGLQYYFLTGKTA